MAKKRLLLLSFPTMDSDARILRQLDALVDDFEVTTCGAGPKPHEGVVEHIPLTAGNKAWARHLQGIALNLKWHTLAYTLIPQVSEARKKLRGRTFDLVFANDLPSAGVAASVAPMERVHLDLHEYWPGLNDNGERWRKIRRPHYEWMLRKHAAPAGGHSTVNRAIASRYKTEYGFSSDVVINAGKYERSLSPSEVGDTIRLVHSGGVNPGRRIDVMMRAVAAAKNDLTLDLYLVGQGSETYAELEALANQLGDRIRILPPVPQAKLVSVLNEYDVGIHVLAPTCTNNKLALPNKFFDFVQARLAMITGPTEAMVEILEERNLGWVTEDFEEASVVETLEQLTPASVRSFKENAHAAAETLGAEQQVPIWLSSISKILSVDEQD